MTMNLKSEIVEWLNKTPQIYKEEPNHLWKTFHTSYEL